MDTGGQFAPAPRQGRITVPFPLPSAGIAPFRQAADMIKVGVRNQHIAHLPLSQPLHHRAPIRTAVDHEGRFIALHHNGRAQAPIVPRIPGFRAYLTIAIYPRNAHGISRSQKVNVSPLT